jgi:hypothetical protein
MRKLVDLLFLGLQNTLHLLKALSGFSLDLSQILVAVGFWSCTTGGQALKLEGTERVILKVFVHKVH